MATKNHSKLQNNVRIRLLKSYCPCTAWAAMVEAAKQNQPTDAGSALYPSTAFTVCPGLLTWRTCASYADSLCLHRGT